MATWPDIANPSALRERPIKGQIRNDFESGYAYSRAKWTRMRYIFELSWKVMHRDDLDTLQSFFNNNLMKFAIFFITADSSRRLKSQL